MIGWLLENTLPKLRSAMNELTKTAVFFVTAAILSLVALMVDPGDVTPDIFDDQGESFFPAFADPQAPRSIEVIDYNEETATAKPLKVEFINNKWVLPSHHYYPADAEKRLASTAAALMELRKDMIISDRIEHHSDYGVIDPLDGNVTTLAGRGKRVTLRDKNGRILADFVVGRKVGGKAGYRYLRVPSQRRTYAVETDADVSAEFSDWIETDLLKLTASDIRKISINSYSINERRGVLENLERNTLSRRGNKWYMSGGRTPRDNKVNALMEALDNLHIVGVQPKPAALTRDLKTRNGIQISVDSVTSLRQKGFFLNAQGQLFSNEGEIIVETANGLKYTLRFGEIAPGAKGAPKEEEAGKDAAAQEYRYLFITVNHDAARAKHYSGKGKSPDQQGEILARELRNRFANWYYVIPGGDFSNLRPSRRDLLRG